MHLSQLLEIAHIVFENREELRDQKLTKVLELLSEKVTKKKEKSQPHFDKCAYCKEMGHWWKNYPKLKSKLEKLAKALLSHN